jgi:EthD domain
MIHQLIFAHPKPGMSEKDFQDYWVNVHAVNYASKIPQIKKYPSELNQKTLDSAALRRFG